MEWTIDGKAYGGFELSGSRAAVLRLLDCIEEVEKGSISIAAVEGTPWFVPNGGGGANKRPSEADGQPSQEPPRAQERATVAPKPDEPSKTVRGYSSGTGFFVNREGYLLTNAHVVNGCTDAFVRQNNTDFVPASIAARDTTNDLAVLKINQSNVAYAKFRGTPPVRLGDSVVVFGFPLTGVLSKTGNLSTGLVASLAGIADDITKIQISAPIQSGNSGGAVVDQSGHVVGVVVSKANLQASGSSDDPQIEVVQNANFAIKAGIAQFFLDANQVHYDVEPPGDDLKVPDIAAEAKDFSAQVMCEIRH
jgi:S1-C subfamily serine protease